MSRLIIVACARVLRFQILTAGTSTGRNLQWHSGGLMCISSIAALCTLSRDNQQPSMGLASPRHRVHYRLQPRNQPAHACPAASQVCHGCTHGSHRLPRLRSRRRSLLRKQPPQRCCRASALLPATSPWGIWAGLALAAAGGFWSERTRVGKELSGAPKPCGCRSCCPQFVDPRVVLYGGYKVVVLPMRALAHAGLEALVRFLDLREHGFPSCAASSQDRL